MANEAVIVELWGQPKGEAINYTVAVGNAIAKGTLGKLVDPRTAAASAADNDPFAGVASAEKLSTSTIVNLGFWSKGIFDIKTSAAVAIGERVSLSGANTVTKCGTADLLFSDVGIALEACAGAEVILILIGSGF